jgi:hypothetical protein
MSFPSAFPSAFESAFPPAIGEEGNSSAVFALDQRIAAGGGTLERGLIEVQTFLDRLRELGLPQPSFVWDPVSMNANISHAVVPETGAGDLTVTRAGSASTRVSRLGVTEVINANIPRINFDLITGAYRGVISEPQATNSIRNNTMAGVVLGVIGSGGAIPTFWEIFDAGGLTREVTATGTENGLNFVDIRFSGTATGAMNLAFNGTLGRTVVEGQQSTASVWMRLIAAPALYDSFVLRIEQTGGSGLTTQAVTLTSSLVRYTATRTAGAAETAHWTRVVAAHTAGNAYDYTIRFAMPQIEGGSIPTTVIPTSSAAITRNADVIEQTNAPSLFGLNQGTFYVEFENVVETRNAWFFSVFGSTTNDRFQFWSDTTNRINASVAVSNVDTGGGTILTGIHNTPARIKVVYRYDLSTNGLKLFVNGVQVGALRTASSLPTLQRVTVGGYAGSATDRLKSSVYRAAIFPVAFSDAQAIALSAL